MDLFRDRSVSFYAMKFLPLVILPLLVLGCAAPRYILFKDNSYYYTRSKVKKTLYMFPVSSLKYDEVTYGKDSLLSEGSAARNDSLLKFFNEEYHRLAGKHNRFTIALVDSPDLRSLRIHGRTGFSREKVFDKKHRKEIEVAIPDSSLLDSLGIRSNYLFCFSDLEVFNTMASHVIIVPIVFPLKNAVLTGGACAMWDGPAFGLRGKYALWDNDSSRLICAGEFERELRSTKLTTQRIKEEFFEIIAGILNRTPFWAI